MFNNYFKIALRNLYKNKTHSLINILGLTIGITACLIIFSYIINELSFDNFHKDADRIFRIGTEIKDKTGEAVFATAHVPVANVLKNDFPQIENAVRFCGGPPQVVRLDNQKNFYEKDNYFRVDLEFFEVFTMPFVFGNPETVLDQPQSVIISETLAHKYFGSENPLGRIVNFDKKDWKITGVFKNIPHNSHFPKFQIVTLFQFPDWASGWDGLKIPTYIKVKTKSNINKLEKQVESLAQTYAGDIVKPSSEIRKYFLQPFKEIHLHSNFLQEYAILGSSKMIVIFSALGFIILFVACLNYINLTTARSINRSKEIGIRKVIGANKAQLFRQFLGESILISSLSILLALIFSEIIILVINRQMGLEIHIAYFSDFTFSIIILSIMFFVGILAGIYPSFILSSFNPTKILKNDYIKAGKKTVVRNFLIIFQFTIASILIIASFVIYQQLHFMKNKELGFDKEQMLILPMQDQNMTQAVSKQLQMLKQEFTKHHSIISATAILRTPGRIEHHDNIELIDGKNSKVVGMNNIFVDHDFINTYNLKMVAGREFKKDISTDVGKAFIINESALKTFGWHKAYEAVGKRLSYWMGDGEIIGVCKDFHLWSLHRSIEHVFFLIPPRIFPEVITLKLNTKNFSESIDFIKEIWKIQFPDYPFEYYFLDDDFNRQYHSDEIFNKIILFFTGLAIFIACIGLFGLASLTIDQRTKEIGIRKVLGSTLSEIVVLLNREFISLIIISSLVACPLAYFVIDKWLQNFAYRIDITIWPFLLAGLSVIVVALFSVCWQVVRVATANPVEALRYE